MPQRTAAPEPSNDSDDFDADDGGPLEVFEADDEPLNIAPDRGDSDAGRSFSASSHVVKIIARCRAFREELHGLFVAVEPSLKDDIAKRTEDTLLKTFEVLAEHLPVNSRRAEENRSRFKIVTGGK